MKSDENADAADRPNLVLTIDDGNGGCNPLPLNWEHFTARASGKNTNLSWSTSDEENTNSLIVTHSPDGRSFTEIGLVSASNQSGLNVYNFVHESPGSGQHFYRITQEDIGGSTTQSPVRSVLFGSSVPSLFPNPVTDALQLRNLASGTQLRLTDSYGRLIRQLTSTPSNTHQIMMEDLPAGIYFLTGRLGSTIWSRKVVKR